MVGPGAWSLDGWLFGWKRIEVGDGRAETSMRTITLEEHYVTPGFLESPGRSFMESATSARSRTANLLEQLREVGDKRISGMDAAGIDVQVLSLNSPGVEQLDEAEALALAGETNDFVVEAVKRNPTRFAGFATLPVAAPKSTPRQNSLAQIPRQFRSSRRQS